MWQEPPADDHGDVDDSDHSTGTNLVSSGSESSQQLDCVTHLLPASTRSCTAPQPSASAGTAATVPTSAAVSVSVVALSTVPLAAPASVTPAVGWLASASASDCSSAVPCPPPATARLTGFGRKRSLASDAALCAHTTQQRRRQKLKRNSVVAESDVQPAHRFGSVGRPARASESSSRGSSEGSVRVSAPAPAVSSEGRVKSFDSPSRPSVDPPLPSAPAPPPSIAPRSRRYPRSGDAPRYSGTLRVWNSEELALQAPLGFQRFVDCLLRTGVVASATQSAERSDSAAATTETAAQHDGQTSLNARSLVIQRSAELYHRHAASRQVVLPFPPLSANERCSSPAHDCTSDSGSDSDSDRCTDSGGDTSSRSNHSKSGASLMPRTKKRAVSMRQSERTQLHHGTAPIENTEAGADASAPSARQQADSDDTAARPSPVQYISWKSYKDETDSPIRPSSPPRFHDSTVQRNVHVTVDHSVYTDAEQPWNWMAARLLGKGRETGWCKKRHQVLVKMLLLHGRDYEQVTKALFEATGYKFHVDHVRMRVKELLAAWEKRGLPLPLEMTKDGLIEYTLAGKKRTKWAVEREQRREQQHRELPAPVIERPPDMPILTHNWLSVTFDFHGVQLSSHVSLHCLTMWWRDDFKSLPLVQSFYNAYHSHPVYQPLADTFIRCSEPHFLAKTNIVPPLPQPDRRKAAWVSAFPVPPLARRAQKQRAVHSHRGSAEGRRSGARQGDRAAQPGQG